MLARGAKQKDTVRRALSGVHGLYDCPVGLVKAILLLEELVHFLTQHWMGTGWKMCFLEAPSRTRPNQPVGWWTKLRSTTLIGQGDRAATSASSELSSFCIASLLLVVRPGAPSSFLSFSDRIYKEVDLCFACASKFPWESVGGDILV